MKKIDAEIADRLLRELSRIYQGMNNNDYELPNNDENYDFVLRADAHANACRSVDEWKAHPVYEPPTVGGDSGAIIYANNIVVADYIRHVIKEEAGKPAPPSPKKKSKKI